jgi:hypothetical protein
MSGSDIARRRFLATTLAAGGLTFWPGTGAPARPQGVADILARLFRVRESAALLGQAYLRQHPEEADKAILERLVAAQLGDLREAEAAGKTALKRSFERAKGRDFERGAVVQLGGFMMSRTELRACALVALG